MDKKKIKEEFSQICLNEMSLSRIWRHSEGATGRPIVFVSASRTWKGKDENDLPIAYTASENKKRNAELEEEIKKTKWGYVPMHGGYIEGFGTPSAREVYEQSFMVIGNPGEDYELRYWAVKMGEANQQDSILYISTNRKAKLIGTNDVNELGEPIKFPGKGKVVVMGDWHIKNKLDQFFSKWKGRKFTFKECANTISHNIDHLGIMGKWAKHAIENGAKVYNSYDESITDEEKKDFFDKLDNKNI
jgi:hypothetical protein